MVRERFMHNVGTASERRIRDSYFRLNSCMYKAFPAGQAARLESSQGARMPPDAGIPSWRKPCSVSGIRTAFRNLSDLTMTESRIHALN